MAAQRINDFYIGWIANPLVFGDYPDTMKKLVGTRIPNFTNHESEHVRGSSDFFGIIHYTRSYIQDDPGSLILKQRDFQIDVAAKILSQRTQRNSTLEDTWREEYLQAYIGSVLDAVRNGSDTRGYFSWSILDVLEILDGYRSSFGLYYIDLDDPDLKRQPKHSSYWYSHFLQTK